MSISDTTPLSCTYEDDALSCTVSSDATQYSPEFLTSTRVALMALTNSLEDAVRRYPLVLEEYFTSVQAWAPILLLLKKHQAIETLQSLLRTVAPFRGRVRSVVIHAKTLLLLFEQVS